MVDRKINGAVRSFSGSASRTAASTRLVPWSFSIRHTRYSSTMAIPSHRIQGSRARSSAAQSIPRWKAAATPPTSSPIPAEYSSHLRNSIPCFIHRPIRLSVCSIFLSPFPVRALRAPQRPSVHADQPRPSPVLPLRGPPPCHRYCTTAPAQRKASARSEGIFRFAHNKRIRNRRISRVSAYRGNQTQSLVIPQSRRDHLP